MISAGLEQVWKEWQTRCQPGAKLADPMRLRISTGKYGGMRFHGQRGLGISLLENHTLAGQAIEKVVTFLVGALGVLIIAATFIVSQRLNKRNTLDHAASTVS